MRVPLFDRIAHVGSVSSGAMRWIHPAAQPPRAVLQSGEYGEHNGIEPLHESQAHGGCEQQHREAHRAEPLLQRDVAEYVSLPKLSSPSLQVARALRRRQTEMAAPPAQLMHASRHYRDRDRAHDDPVHHGMHRPRSVIASVIPSDGTPRTPAESGTRTAVTDPPPSGVIPERWPSRPSYIQAELKRAVRSV